MCDGDFKAPYESGNVIKIKNLRNVYLTDTEFMDLL